MSANQNIQASIEARAFAKTHLKVLARELIQWQDTSILPQGKMRELAAIWATVDHQYAIKLAENTVTRAALDAAVYS